MLKPAHTLPFALALAVVLGLSAPAVARDKPTGAHEIAGAVIKINGKTTDGVLSDLPPGPSSPKGAGANAMSLDDTAGKEKAPTSRPKPESGLNETITVHGHRTENTTAFDYPGAYVQRFDGGKGAPAPQTSVNRIRTTPLWGARYGRY